LGKAFHNSARIESEILLPDNKFYRKINYQAELVVNVRRAFGDFADFGLGLSCCGCIIEHTSSDFDGAIAEGHEARITIGTALVEVSSEKFSIHIHAGVNVEFGRGEVENMENLSAINACLWFAEKQRLSETEGLDRCASFAINELGVELGPG
jgi:hypothetical protein